MINDELLSELPDILVERIQNANTYCLKVLARHIKKIGEITASDVNMIDEMQRTGVNIEKIIAELDKTDAKNAKDIAVLFEKTAEDSADNSKIYYKAAGVEFVPYSKNENLQKMVKSIEKMTLGKYLNMSQTRVVKLLDKSKKPVVLSLEEAYKEVIDQAVTNVSLGYQGYQSAMEDILKAFSKSGIRCVEYESSVTRRLDSAVRMNVLEGVRQVSQGVQDAVGEEFGADGKEISAHSYCAPDHEPYQGRQYTNEEYAKLEERLSYPNRGIGKLNCRHFTYSIIVGVSPPIYSEKELKEFEQKNAEGIEYEGKHYTMYEATQVQRKLETSIRYAYDDAETAKEAGLKNWEEEARKRVRVLTRKYKDFSDYAGLPYKKNRLKTYAVKSKSLTKDSKGDIIKDEERLRIPQIPSSTISRKINNGEYSTALSKQHYLKHIEGSSQFDLYKTSRISKGNNPQSILLINESEAQEIINTKAGTGIVDVDRKGQPKQIEFVSCNKVIGKYYGGGTYHNTTKCAIHYGKKNAHIVPIKGDFYD